MGVVSEIHAWNRGRELQRLRLKYAKMETDAFSFFRGTAHLFFRDWPLDRALDDAPLVWVCGDLHLENFGSFRGDDGRAYFDVNDFLLGPWLLKRLGPAQAAALAAAAGVKNGAKKTALKLSAVFLIPHGATLVSPVPTG